MSDVVRIPHTEYPLSKIDYPPLLSIDQYLQKARQRLVAAGMQQLKVEEQLLAMWWELHVVKSKVEGIE